MPYQLIIFDCDGVLVDSEDITSRVFLREVAKLGLELDQDHFTEQFAGTSYAVCVAHVEEKLGRSVPPDFADTFRQASFDAFRKELQPIPGIREVLAGLNHDCCVASNGPRNKIELNLGITNLLPYFKDQIFSAYELNIFKPDPRFYLQVANTLGYEKSKCLVVEDSLSGVRSARGAGIEVVAYAPHSKKAEELRAEGAHILTDMSYLPQFIEIPG